METRGNWGEMVEISEQFFVSRLVINLACAAMVPVPEVEAIVVDRGSNEQTGR